MAAKNRSDQPAPEPVDGDGLDPDLLDLEEGVELEAEGSHQGIGRRASGHPADREHGVKTRVRSKQIVSGRPYAS
ncbi:MAG: hypothetical protein ACREEO_15820 [Phenylobacterium sp.]